jgi:hypothetical protein
MSRIEDNKTQLDEEIQNLSIGMDNKEGEDLQNTQREIDDVKAQAQ